MKIGSLHLTNTIWLAPMAGITTLPYRLIMKKFGAALVFTEMVSANGLLHSGRRTRVLLDSSEDEMPLGIQLFGDDPDSLAKAAAMVEGDGDLLDINMGCPVKKVVRCGSGSALLRTPEKIGQIVAAIRRVTNRPLTIKIRSGWDQQSINFLEVARIAENEGVDAITLHPRTRCQGFSGQADWQQIRRLKESISIPVIGSGDISSATDALKMQQLTGCDGVMIGRGAYGNPWLIRDVQAILSGTAVPVPPTAAERLVVASHHLQLFTRTYGPRRALLDMRKHLCWYSRGLEGAAAYREAVNRAQSINELQQITSTFFQSGLILTETNHREQTT